ncbi:hypothetical protein [Bacillus sp. NPDC057893]|uniref:hypothetical protein n=1 Tax=Bacillus sp. NPDC057893 TaxID=3346273 RepID=UPI003672C425
MFRLLAVILKKVNVHMRIETEEGHSMEIYYGLFLYVPWLSYAYVFFQIIK